MPTYQVLWKYSSGLGGPWEEGEVVELEEWRANHINVDSPGVLKPVPTPGPSLKGGDKKTGKGGKNRMVTKAENRTVQEPFVMGKDQPGYGQELLPDKDDE